MRNKSIFLLFYVFCSSVSSVWGAPAINLQLSYDSKKIYIDADHPSDRLDRDFIQKVVVTRNSNDKKYFYFSHQKSASKFIAILDYPANTGDHLGIELYSSEGGITQGGIDIP